VRQLDEEDPVPLTCASYAADAQTYASWSEQYRNFPGLRRQLSRFLRDALLGLPILDAGCGAGRDSIAIVGSGRDVISLDRTYALLTYESPHLGLLARSPAKIQADLRAIPLANGSVGGIWACASLIHIPDDDLQPTLEMMAKLLAVGAPIWASFKATGQKGWTTRGRISGPRWQSAHQESELITHFRNAGFETLSIERHHSDWFAVTAYARS
jgi:SAM-dependent methyltransferase